MSRKAMVFLAVGVALTLGLFFGFKQSRPVVQLAPEAASITTALPLVEKPQTEVTATTALRQFELVVKGKKLIDGPQVLQVNEGDEVIISITSDIAEELHLHGYNQKVDLEPTRLGTLRFVADRSGRFEYELEKSRVELGVLEVQPK